MTPSSGFSRRTVPDLDRAIKIAVQKTIDFLGRTQGMTVADAFSFASLAVNYHVTDVHIGHPTPRL